MDRPDKAQKRVCPVSRKCGGCQLMNLPYADQLRMKQALVNKLMRPFGKPAFIIGMDAPFHYRCKVQAAFSTTRGGQIVAGVYRAGTHTVVKTDGCLIENETADAIVDTVRRLLPRFHLTAYDEDSGRGFLRHVLVRVGWRTGQLLVVPVTASPDFPCKEEFVEALLKAHPQITSIVQNINPGHTSMVLGERETVLYGPGYIEDELCGCRFRLSPRSFYQVNPAQTEILYQKAVAFAGLSGGERVLDAYCGVGTIGLVAAKSGASVVGVEVNADAVRDARVNAALNGAENAEFLCADAGEYMTAAAERGERFDVVFTDPPRAGCSRAFLTALATLAPAKIVYISCNPATLARDLHTLQKSGYAVKKIQPVDMFPYTRHVETVVRLSRSDMNSCRNS